MTLGVGRRRKVSRVRTRFVANDSREEESEHSTKRTVGMSWEAARHKIKHLSIRSEARERRENARLKLLEDSLDFAWNFVRSLRKAHDCLMTRRVSSCIWKHDDQLEAIRECRMENSKLSKPKDSVTSSTLKEGSHKRVQTHLNRFVALFLEFLDHLPIFTTVLSNQLCYVGRILLPRSHLALGD